MSIRIEKGVPIPPRKNGHGSIFDSLPWKELNIGDSFEYDGNPSAMHKAAARAGIKIIIKATEKVGNVNLKFRVWRIE